MTKQEIIDEIARMPEETLMELELIIRERLYGTGEDQTHGYSESQMEELRRRYQQVAEHPEELLTWDEVMDQVEEEFGFRV